MEYRFHKTHISATTNSGDVFMFDVKDYKKVSVHPSWWIDAQGYVRTEKIIEGKRVSIKLHNLVMGITPSKNIMIDHINRNKKDNRRSNLRLVNKKQNALNSKIQSNNTSGVRGVSFCKHGKWEAYIKVDGRKIYLGVYTEKDDAIRTRLLAEIKYFGAEFSPQKHIFSDFNIKE